MDGSGEAASVQGQICFALSFGSRCVMNRTHKVYTYYFEGNLVFCSWVDFLAVLLAGFCTGPRKPGKSWNFIMAFSRTGKSWKKAIGPGKFWQSVKTQLKNMKCMEGSVGVNVNFRDLEKTI